MTHADESGALTPRGGSIFFMWEPNLDFAYPGLKKPEKNPMDPGDAKWGVAHQFIDTVGVTFNTM